MKDEKYSGEVLRQILKHRVNMNIIKHMHTNFRERRTKKMQKFLASSKDISTWFEVDRVPKDSSWYKETNFKTFSASNRTHQ